MALPGKLCMHSNSFQSIYHPTPCSLLYSVWPRTSYPSKNAEHVKTWSKLCMSDWIRKGKKVKKKEDEEIDHFENCRKGNGESENESYPPITGSRMATSPKIDKSSGASIAVISSSLQIPTISKSSIVTLEVVAEKRMLCFPASQL